jgi:hypothetical protein
MATFVLVHGAWHGSWCWKHVRKALREQGHDVFTPTLTGVGARSHLLSRDVNLDTQQLSGGARSIAHVTFILATGFVRGSPFPPFYEKAKARGWNTITVPCGHDVMLDLPDDLTKILVDASARAEASD